MNNFCLSDLTRKTHRMVKMTYFNVSWKTLALFETHLKKHWDGGSIKAGKLSYAKKKEWEKHFVPNQVNWQQVTNGKCKCCALNYSLNYNDDDHSDIKLVIQTRNSSGRCKSNDKILTLFLIPRQSPPAG